MSLKHRFGIRGLSIHALVFLFFAPLMVACGGGGSDSADTTAPDTLILIRPAALSNSSDANFTFSSSEEFSSFEVSLDNSDFISTASILVSGASAYTAFGLSDGTHTFAVRATDEAGNTDQTPASYSWTIDTVPPETGPITNPPPALSNSPDASFEFTSPEPGVSFEVSLDGALFVAANSPHAVNGLSNGEHTFAVRAVDAAGNADTTPTSYTWTVDQPVSIYYVSSLAADNNGDGTTPASAKRDIQAMVSAITNFPAIIHVNAGTYMVDSTPGVDTNIQLPDQVTLLGGHNADFTFRDPAVNVSTITDTSAFLAGLYGTVQTIEFIAGATSSTVVDGFTVQGSNASQFSTAIEINNASPTIRNCVIHGGSGSVHTIGIHTTDSNSLIENNTIYGGDSGTGVSYGLQMDSNSTVTALNNQINGGGSSFQTTGISIFNSAPQIRDNEINGGEVNASTATGVDIMNSSSAVLDGNNIHGGVAEVTAGIWTRNNATALVTNNLIHSGTSTVYPSAGIWNGDNLNSANVTAINNTIYVKDNPTIDDFAVYNAQGNFTLENNILLTLGSTSTTAIGQLNGSADYATIANNNVSGFTTSYIDQDGNCTGNGDADGNNTTCTLAEMETATGNSGNVPFDPVFVDIDGDDNDIDSMSDNNWRLTPGANFPEVFEGGLNRSALFTVDFDDMTRSAAILNSPINPNAAGWSMGAYEVDF